MQVVDPKIAVHPLRLELTEDQVRALLARVLEDDITLTFEEIDCAADWLYDYHAGQIQTVHGTTVLQ